MNEITNNLVEVLDENGNPTGQYRPRETTSTETAFVAEDSGHHVI